MSEQMRELVADGAAVKEVKRTDTRMRYMLESVLPPALFLLSLGLLWEIIVTVQNISPIILPKPSAIFAELVENARYYFRNGAVTFYEAIAGFIVGAIVAMVIAAILAR